MRKRKILMANSKVKRKYICPTCKGNGFLKITYPEEMIQQCWDCDSQGELYEYEMKNLILTVYQKTTLKDIIKCILQMII